MVRYDVFLKFLILFSLFSIFAYSNIERFYQPVFNYFVTAILFFYFSGTVLCFLSVYGFTVSFFFFPPPWMQVFLIAVVVFIIYLMLSCFISVSTSFFLPVCFLLCLPCLGFFHTLYIRIKRSFLE